VVGSRGLFSRERDADEPAVTQTELDGVLEASGLNRFPWAEP